MVVVLDSEYLYKGITEWSPKWHRHLWRVKSREVGHSHFSIAAGCRGLVEICVNAVPHGGGGEQQGR